MSAIPASVVCKDGEREILTQDSVGGNSGWKMTLIGTAGGLSVDVSS